MVQGSLIVDSTDFRTGGNENAASILDCRGRLLKKAANEAAGERKPEAYPRGTLRILSNRERSWGSFSAACLLEDFSILTRVHPRLVSKAEGGTVGIAGVVEIDAIVPADGFHCDFKGNGLGVEITWCMRAASQDANHVGLRILGIGHDVDVGDGMAP